MTRMFGLAFGLQRALVRRNEAKRITPGQLTIYLQPGSEGTAREPNWLPTSAPRSVVRDPADVPAARRADQGRLGMPRNYAGRLTTGRHMTATRRKARERAELTALCGAATRRTGARVIMVLAPGWSKPRLAAQNK